MSLRAIRSAGNWAWWSADFSGSTGQAIVTRRVIRFLQGTGARGFSYKPGGFQSIPTWLTSVMRMWLSLSTDGLNSLYLVCSRSNAGFMRDLPAYFLIFFGVRIIVHTHGSDIVDLCHRPWIGPVARFFLARSTLILPSAHLESSLRGIGMKTLYTCENFFESMSPVSTTSSMRLDEARTEFLVFWNSNIMASKGFFLVAQAVRRLFTEGLRVRLRAVGDCIGDEVMNVNACENALSRLRTEPWIDYLGAVSRDQVVQLLGAADVVCLPSTYSSECQPLALIEAMCAGCRVVIADTPALRCTVGDYPASVVAVPPTEELIAASLRKLIFSSESERLELEAAERARARFSIDRFDREIRTLLQ